MMSVRTPDAEQQATYSVSREVSPGLEREYEAYLDGMLAAMSRISGFRDARVYRPARGSRTYRFVVRFERESDLHSWKQSDEGKAWHARGDELGDEPPSVANLTGTAQERALAMTLSPLQSFVQTSVSGIGLLLLGTVLALIMANSPLSGRYDAFWETHLTIGIGRFGIDESLRHWVNDALMALFFFILGLEIKREFLVGELRSPRQAALPISAAIGGAIVPALIYIGLNLGGAGMDGWAIPMATDTAFSLGILSILGSRVPPLLLVFLTAFAIVDDILAVIVIAIFYTDVISWPALGIAAALLGVLVVANAAGFHRWPVFAFVGAGVWLAVFQSGVHGTVAGILVALTVPARSWINPSEFLVRARQSIDDFEQACFVTTSILTNEPQQRATQSLEHLCEEVETPMTHLQHQLNPWVAYGILPLFAFANAGIPIANGFDDIVGSPVTVGVMFGLLLGKPIGIVCFAWLAVRTGIAIRSPAITWPIIGGVAILGGIGFTISLFVTELAFTGTAEADAARIGILAASIIAGTAGYFVLRASLAPRRSDAAALQEASA